MSAPIEPVPAAPNSPEVTPLPRVSSADDLLGWGMLSLPVLGGLIHLLVPFRSYAILLSVGLGLLLVYLIGREARERRRPHGAWVVGAVVALPVALLLVSHFRKHWGAPWRLPHAVAAVAVCVVGILLHGKLWEKPPFGPAATVTVSCRAKSVEVPVKAKDGYLCTPSHVSGYLNARACWDLSLTCANGTPLREHVCAQVTLGHVRESEVPFVYSPGIDACDGIEKASVDNLHVEVDPPW